ncbi:MAG TPA: hypothetical protein VFC16_07055 [Nakamurella sp.]|nr:hypothetical protein [Nakamurella sp.]
MTAANTPSSARSSLGRVHDALESAGRRPRRDKADHFMAHCPLHDDRKSSLSVTWVAEDGGKTLLNCFSCGAQMQDILAAVGLRGSDRYDQPLPQEQKRKTAGGGRSSVAPAGNRLGPLPNRLTTDPAPMEPEILVPKHEARRYDYVDEDGKVLGRVIRHEWTTSVGPDKSFSQERPDGRGGWAGVSPDRKVLRHLPAVIEAIADGREIWLAEGEKDDESLNQSLDRTRAVATTNAGGAGNFGSLVEQLRGAHVVAVLDRDVAGYRRGIAVHRTLEGIAASSRTVLPATTAVKSDATDHLAAGHRVDDFIAVSVEQLAVLVLDADAHEAAAAAEQAEARSRLCGREVLARLAKAADTQKRKAVKTAAEDRRFAVRWAHEAAKAADRAGNRADAAWKLNEQVQAQLHTLGGDLPATTSSRDAVDRAEQAQRRAQRLAQQAWDATGAPMPQPISEQLSAMTPTARYGAAVPLPAPEPGSPDTGDGPDAEVLPFPGTDGRGGGGRRRINAVRTVYERVDGQGLYEVKTQNGNTTHVEVLSLDVRVVRAERYELPPTAQDRDGIPTITPQTVAYYVITYTHPETSELMTVRIEADRANACDWLQDLGELVDYDSSSKGRAKVWDAIRHTSKDFERVTLYESCGWRDLPGKGWTYLHSGGGITADGTIPLRVRLPDAIARIDLPDPITDAGTLRELFDRHSLAMTTRLPGRVGAVLTGAAYRAVLGVTKPPTVLYGVPGTYKSAIAALTMHHFGTAWERSGASTSMSGHGATINALPELWYHAKDALFFGDDFAPDKSHEAAASFLSAVSRLQYNLEVRTRVNMRLRGGRGGVQIGFVTRTSQLLTSEVKASADSGDQRSTTVDLAKGEVQLSDILVLDEAESRLGRATVMASLLSWMARDQPTHVARAQQRAALAAGRRRAAGAGDRVAEPLGELEAGWELVGDWLVDIGAYTGQERDGMLARIRDALTEAGERSQDPDSPTSVGERCRRLIDSALRSGAAHVTYPGGDTPPLKEAMRLGYRRVAMSMSGDGDSFRLDPRGEQLGVFARTTHGTRLHLDPDATMGVILTCARRAGEPLQVTKYVVSHELAAIGVLRTEIISGGTRYSCTVPDPSGAGGQVKRWDLDADRVFNEPDAEPDPEPNGGPDPDPMVPDPVGAGSYPPAHHDDTADRDDEADDEMAKRYEQTSHHIGPSAPCSRCTNQCSLYIDGVCIHYPCWKTTADNAEWVPPQAADATTGATVAAPEPESPTPPGAGESSPADPVPEHDDPGRSMARPAAVEVAAKLQTRPPAPRPTNGRPAYRAARDNAFTYPAVVLDVTGTYTPDGRIHPAAAITCVADVAAVGETLRVGHPAAPGTLVLTEALFSQLGMLPDADLLTAPDNDGQQATPDVIRQRIMDHLGTQTGFLQNTAGWTADGQSMGPWTTVRCGPRAFRLVIEPYVWLWDPRDDSPSPFRQLPDPEQDPAACWSELARRLGRLAELLDLPWSSSAGVTGAALFDRIRRRRVLAAERAQDPAERERLDRRVLHSAGVLPDLDHTGQAQLETEVGWSRLITAAELDKATNVHFYDRRGSYLAPMGGADLPVGDPERFTADETRAVTDQIATGGGVFPAGVWRVTLPAWDQPMPPPHPEQHRYEPVQRWVSTPTLRLLLDHDDKGGAGYTVEELQLGQAWIWPDQARLLEPWYKQVRSALLAAREEEGRSDGPLSSCIKGIYTVYIGRMDVGRLAKGPRPWHYQPVWRANILASSRSGLWRVLRQHQLATGRTPVAIHIDEVAYLDDHEDPTVNPPAPDTGNLGKFKVSKSLTLTDEIRRKIVKGAHVADERLWPAPPGES